MNKTTLNIAKQSDRDVIINIEVKLDGQGKTEKRIEYWEKE